MTLYTFHDLTLEVEQEEAETAEQLAQLLSDLSWVRTQSQVRRPLLRLSVRLNGPGLRVPGMAREVFRDAEFCGREDGEDFYLTDGSSVFHLHPVRGQGAAQLAPTFFDKPAFLQRYFWSFGLLKLLRSVGLYSLHAAGVVTRQGLGLLIVGESGSGKSTLAIGLTQQGWSYLSDDAVVLRLQPQGVEALALRKHFYVDAAAAAAYPDLPVGEETLDIFWRPKRKVDIQETYPEQSVSRCLPRVVLFSQIVPQPHSAVLPLDRLSALRHLLAQSGPQLFDRRTMEPHLEVLKRLVQQTATYELRAGLDLYQNPATLVDLLTHAHGAEEWPGL